MSEGNGRDTDKSELGSGDRLTPVDPPLTLEALLAEVQGSIAEANALSILSRTASEACSNVCMRLLQELRTAESDLSKLRRRVEDIAEHVGMGAP